jgi:hypothetical protein
MKVGGSFLLSLPDKAHKLTRRMAAVLSTHRLISTRGSLQWTQSQASSAHILAKNLEVTTAVVESRLGLRLYAAGRARN